MSLTPDDLPEDPFGEGGMAQVGCGCTSENMRLVLTSGGMAQVRCASCQTLQAEFPAALETGGRFADSPWGSAPEQMQPRGLAPGIGERTTIQPPPEFQRPAPQVGAAWVDTSGQPPPTEAEIRAAKDLPPVRITRDDLTQETRAHGGCSCGPAVDPACPQHGTLSSPFEPAIPARNPSARVLPPLPQFSAGMCNIYLDGGPYDGQITWTMAGPGADFAVAGVGLYRQTQAVRDGRVVYRWAG